MRKSYDDIKQIQEKLGTDRLWSWSRVNKYRTSSFEYYLSYIKHEKGEAEMSAYAPCGSSCHSILEDLYEGRIKYENMLDKWEDDFLENIDIYGAKFDRSDSEANDRIRSGYKDNIDHFFLNHTPITTKTAIEQFVTIDLGNGEFMQGYIDATTKDNEGRFHVIDFKSSSMYRNQKLIDNSTQLILYGIALVQKGVPREKVVPEFNFLKYTTIHFQDAKGNWKQRDVERRKIGDSMKSNVKMHLKKLGYTEDEYSEYIEEMIMNNTTKFLPKEMQDKLKFEDCYVRVDFSQDNIDRVLEEVRQTIKEIRDKEAEYKETEDETIWYDSDEDMEKNSYYYGVLCEYSIPQLKPYADYLSRKEKEKNGGLFGVEKDEDDMSWLNDL